MEGFHQSSQQGLEALIFTAEGDMRQALNNAQATQAGFGFISAENVFKVHHVLHQRPETTSTVFFNVSSVFIV